MFYGIVLLIFAIGSWVLPRNFGVQFWIMSWVDNWGLTVGIILRCLLGAAGLALIIKSIMAKTRR
jgi:hypothetical protein